MGENNKQAKTPETAQPNPPVKTPASRPKIKLKTRLENLTTRLLGDDGRRMVKRHNGPIGIGVLVLGIVGDMTTLLGPWTKTTAFICGLAVCVFFLLSIFKPEQRRRWAVPFVAALMMFTMSIFVLAGQSAMAAQERGMMGSVSPKIAKWQDSMAKRLKRVEENTETIIEQNDDIGAKIDANTVRLEALIKQMSNAGQYESQIGDFYPQYLAKILLKSNILEKNWQAEISTALRRYIDGKAQLSQSIGLTPKLETKRKQALTLFEKAKLDETEALLLEIDKEISGQFEKTAKDRATLLVDRAVIAAARLDFDMAISLYEQAAQTIVTIDKTKAVVWFGSAADIGRKRYDIGGEPRFAKYAVKLYESLIGYISTQNERAGIGQETRWAATHNNLGNVYSVMGERGVDGALEQAISAYENALLEYTRAKAPMAWAVTHNNLGGVYQVMGERGVDGALEQAISAYENALLVRTRAKAPMDWAATHNNLGIVYRVMGERGVEGALEQAVSVYENVLLEYTRAKAPMAWATVYNNLGTVYRVMGERGVDGALEQAISAFENALLERTRAKAPMDWAMTKFNFGLALWAQGKKDAAEACFRDALAVFREQKAQFYISKIEETMRKRGLEP